MRRLITELQAATSCFISGQQSSYRGGRAQSHGYSRLLRDAQIAMLNLWPGLTMACIERAWICRQLLELSLQFIIYYQISNYLTQLVNS